MPRSFIVALALLVIISCTSCGMLSLPSPALPGVTPLPESPISTPPANSEPSMPTPPTPAPGGIMPSVLAEINLGPAVGNGFQPVALALDEAQQAFVLCESSDQVAGQSCIVRADLAARTTLDLWSLPGRVAGLLSVGGGRVYAVYRDQGGHQRLAIVDAATGQLRGDMDIGAISPRQMALDAARKRLYLAGDAQIEVRDVETLKVVGALPYPFQATDQQVAFDLEADRLYLSVSSVLYAYRATDLSLLWTREAPTQRITGLIVDASGTRLLAQGSSEEQGQTARRVLLYTSEGEPAGEVMPQGVEEWQLVWADAAASDGAGRIVYQETAYATQGARTRLWSSDMAGQAVGGPVLLESGSRVCALPRVRDLYIPNRLAHTVTPVQAASLELGMGTALGVELRDLVVDHDQARIYVNDTASRLYAVNVSSMAQGTLALEQAVAAGSGDLLLDDAGGTLLVSRYAGDQDSIAVLDQGSLRVTQVITGGNLMALDTRRGRAIVSAPVNLYPPFDGRAFVWDLARRELVGVIAEGGQPAYNPLRDEIYLAGHSCHAYDAGTLERVGSLAPDIDAQTCPGCMGQSAVVDVGVYPALNAIVLHTTVTSAGKGPGDLPLPRVLALDTLEPISHTLTILPACCGEWLVYPPTDGRVYEQRRYSRYGTQSNVIVRQWDSGEAVSQRDGLSLELLIPDSGLAFVERGGNWLALDAATWTPVGYAPRFQVHSYDAEMDCLLAVEGSWLRVLRPTGGEPLVLDAALGAQPRSAIRSLDAARGDAARGDAADGALFAVTDEGVYRQRAEGASWELMRGGLPDVRGADEAHLALTVSPDYAQDRTLFVGGWADGRGLGVWRSTDGGDSWRPVWQGLEHLLVESLALSPNYGQDQTLLAYCQYSDLLLGETGRSVWKSVDGGGQWELLARAPDGSAQPLPQAGDVWGQATRQVSMRGARGNRVIERDTGEDWQVALKLAPRELLVSIEPAPESAADQAVYALSTLRLYRSVDAGASWQMAGLSLATDPDGQRLTAMEIAVGGDGQPVVWLGDSAGQVHSFRADELLWEAVPQTP
ncbi:MAG: hypothetical protein GX552_18930 [Chloroflexi bacterium]|nr:hypothetical protein [Chloroflexota bacterium]